MSRVAGIVALFFTAFLLTSPVATAQAPNVQIGGTFGFGGWNGPNGGGAYGPYGGGFSPYGGYGFSPYGGYGYGGGFGYSPYAGYGGGFGGFGYGPFNYGQQLFQQQASLTQQIYMQQQHVILDQLQAAQSRLESLDATKQQLFQQYLGTSDTEKAAVRAGMINNYLRLDPYGRDGWKRDPVVQIILGQDLPRLDGLAQFRELSEPDQTEFRHAMLEKYRSLSAPDQQLWRSDQIVGNIMGRDWWQQ
ncbi:MAG TPA: hypothetical protein VHY91_08615 [Pirellulales bacterium]|nr:hypothetical protein [Pirellulales bacterium]